MFLGTQTYLSKYIAAALFLTSLGIEQAVGMPPGRPAFHPPPHVTSVPHMEHVPPPHISESGPSEWREHDIFAPKKAVIDSLPGGASHESKYNAEGTPGERYWKRMTTKFGAVNQVAKATIFIQSFEGTLYLTTNYVRSGSVDAPVFFMKPEDLLNDSFMQHKIDQLMGGSQLADTTMLKIFLDKDVDSTDFNSIFNKSDQSLRINNSKLRHAEIYIKDDQAISLIRIDRPAPPPRWAAKFNECCVRTGIPPDWVGWHKLGEIPFDKERVQIISLFADSETSDRLGSLDPKSNIRKPSEIQGDPVVALKSLIESGDASSPVLIIGHVEGASFKVEGRNGFSVPINAILKIIQETGRPVFLVGCYTLEYMASKSGMKDFAGIANEFYPREIVPKIINSQKNSSNLKEFIENISGEGSQVWVSNDFIKAVNNNSVIAVRGAISKPMPNGLTSIVGILRLYIPCRMFGRCA